MATQAQLDILASFYAAAKVAKHIFPEAAACEAAVETGWGTSELYRRYRNVFGQKQSHPPIYTSVSLPTVEYIRGAKVTQTADFVVFPTAAEAFEARMDLLIRLAPSYLEYNAALHATTPEAYLNAVSRRWSTDPNRAASCTLILHGHPGLFQEIA